jgi:hypothetical protein
LASAAEESGADAGAISPSGCAETVVEDDGSLESALPVEQPVRARTARALRLRTVVV